MKDDTATLSSLGIGPSSKVLLMGTKPDVCEKITINQYIYIYF